LTTAAVIAAHDSGFLSGHHNPWLVALSVVIAFTAAYAALDLASRMTAARGRARAAWLVGGAFAMGLGIWSMHYVGMLAFRLPIPVRYDLPTALLSLLAATFASAIALWVASRSEVSHAASVGASVVLGCGIAVMHYTGMSAMRLSATVSYDPALLVASILVAILVSLAALWRGVFLRDPAASGWGLRKLATAALMGLAISGMHFTGMSATRFRLTTFTFTPPPGFDISILGTAAMVVLTFTVLGLAITTSLLDRRFAVRLARLHASEEQHQTFLRQVIDNNPHLVFVKDWDGNYVLVNKATAEFYNTTVDKVVGRRDSDFNRHPEQVESFLRADREVMSSQRVKLIPEEPATNARTGETHWFQVVKVPLSSSKGGTPQVLGIGTDITQRRQAEENLRRTGQMLQTLIDAAPLAICSLDTEGRVRIWNRAAEELFRWSAEEAAGQVMPIVPPEDMHAFKASLGQVLAGEPLAGLVVRRRRRDGMMLDLRISAAPTRAQDGSIDGGIAVIEDITERKSLGEQLRQAQKMEAVGQLTGGIAHDFNNLLTIVITNAGLMADQLTPEQADVRAELAELQRAALRGADLVRKLLAFSRRRALELRPLNLADVIREAETALRRLLPATVQVSAQCEGVTGPTINGDAGAIEQILFNLATNSRDAMPNGGSFRVRLHRAWLDEDHRRTRGWGTSGEYIVVAVSDTGCGMTPQVRARVFDPFFTTKEVGKGTGLGMAMIYGLMKQHSGYIDLESEVGRGTTVRLFFPAASGTPVPSTADPTRSAALGGTERILVVDDEEGIRRSALRVLTRYGYSVEEATDGEGALELLNNGASDVDLVLSDIVMPRKGGLALYEELRSRGKRVLLMSGYTSGDFDALNQVQPSLRILHKPWTVTDLLRAIRAALDEQASV
jgi:two-component system cell cycle sensor histidine kinase/response regulator CckA